MLYTFSALKNGVLLELDFQFVLHARLDIEKDIKVTIARRCTKVPPLPIPNREVKLRHADGTANCGRVGSRRFREKDPRGRDTSGIFVFIQVLF